MVYNYSKDDSIHEVVAYWPLINNMYKDNELKYLSHNNYNGIYSLEMNADNLKENINIYIDSINTFVLEREYYTS